jgi:Tfp pilus assembly protein PilF
MKKEQWREAITLLKESEALVENHWELLWNLGWSHLKLERLDQADKYLSKAFRIAPSNRNHICKFGLGMVYLEKKHYTKAERALSDVLRIKEIYVARLGLALAYFERGKIQEAEYTHLEGIKLRPKSCERYEAYADFLSDVGREAESIKMNKKAKGLKRIN